MMDNREPWFEECEDCNCDTFRVRVTPLGRFASDTDYLCTDCGEIVGGVISDPLNELPSTPYSEFIEKDEENESKV